ncbi:MAG: hypothetical protein AAB792_00525 [Patescibacteria group bacterium]
MSLEQPPKKENNKKPDALKKEGDSQINPENRRTFMKKVFMGTLGLALGESKLEAARKREYLTGKLEGRVMSDLFSLYTGIRGKTPPVAKIDFSYQLRKMWDIKERRSRKNRVVVETGTKLNRAYAEGRLTQINLENYLKWLDKILREVKEFIDWDSVARTKQLDNKELELVRDISQAITAKDLAAYSLTELMPSQDGVLNAAVLEFLLKNAGREYIESIPALYDPKTSFGPFQFTEYALYDVPKRGRRGASVINQALPEEQKIPGSVSMLRGAQHYKAAFLFMIDNIANVVNRAKGKRYEILKRVWKSHKDSLVMFIATAHHMPGSALGAAERWLDNQARSPYFISCGLHLRHYALKTKANLEALSKL